MMIAAAAAVDTVVEEAAAMIDTNILLAQQSWRSKVFNIHRYWVQYEYQPRLNAD